MQRNLTIRIDEELFRWARIEAAKKNASLSRFVGEMLQEKMRRDERHWASYEQWKANLQLAPVSAANRASREATHDRSNRG